VKTLRSVASARSAKGEHHEQLAAHEESPAASDRSVGLVLAGAATVAALLPLLRGQPARLWALAVAAPLLFLAVVRPRWLRPLNRAWTALGAIGNRVTTLALMGFIFYGVITPVAWVLRSRGHDVLRLRRDPVATTYWLERRPPGPSPASMKNQF
jgi:saxitoxin biosynthesis operon SxtJ-like protein